MIDVKKKASMKKPYEGKGMKDAKKAMSGEKRGRKGRNDKTAKAPQMGMACGGKMKKK